MSYNKTNHKNAIHKIVKEKRMILLIDVASIMNKSSSTINSTAKSLNKEGKIKMQKIKARYQNGNLNDVWLLYLPEVKQEEILDYEKTLINKPFVSPLKKNHCYKKNEKPIESITADTKQNIDKPGLMNYFEQEEKIDKNNLTVLTNEVIPIYDNNGERIVNARELHTFLQVKDKFATWMTRRIDKYGFIENLDYVCISQKCETSTGSTVKKEYYLKMDTAKEIAMVENNDRGKYIRKYFITIEKEYKKQNTMLPSNNIEALKLIVNQMEKQDTRLNSLEEKLNRIAEVIGGR
jgi:phage anti-repressor protein